MANLRALGSATCQYWQSKAQSFFRLPLNPLMQWFFLTPKHVKCPSVSDTNSKLWITRPDIPSSLKAHTAANLKYLFIETNINNWHGAVLLFYFRIGKISQHAKLMNATSHWHSERSRCGSNFSLLLGLDREVTLRSTPCFHFFFCFFLEGGELPGGRFWRKTSQFRQINKAFLSHLMFGLIRKRIRAIKRGDILKGGHFFKSK